MNKSYQKYIIYFLILSLFVIFGSSVYYRFSNPELVKLRGGAANSGNTQAGDMNVMLGALMQRVQEQPNDIQALITLTESFIASEDFANAEIFAKRAMVAEPANFLPQYLLGLAVQAQGRSQEAADILEALVTTNDDISARYSLAMIYVYYLHDDVKGKLHLEQALSSPSLSGDSALELKQAIHDELQKFKPAE